MFKEVLKHITTFECNDFAGGVHDGRVGRDWSTDRVGCISHVNDDNLCCISNLFPDTQEFVRLHGESGEANVCSVDADILKLKNKTKTIIINSLNKLDNVLLAERLVLWASTQSARVRFPV